MAKLRQITIGGTTYELKDNALTAIVNAIMAGTQPTGSATVQGETYWLPTSTDAARWDEIKDMDLFNLKGSVASYAQLPVDASVGDVYLIANATSGYTEEWVKTDTGWELLGTVSGSIDISGKEDKSQVKALFDGFTATLISGTTDEYVLTIPQCDNGGSIVTNS